MKHAREGQVLVLRGQLDVRCTAQLRELLYDLIDHAEGAVVVDLTEVDSVDMTTLKLLAVATRVARRRGGSLVLSGASSGVRRLCHLSHLRSVLTLAPASSEASRPARPAV